jgi:hypothetical protein
MTRFARFRKTLRELREIAEVVCREYDKENPLEVDIERTLESRYHLTIDIGALDPACGVEAFLNLTAKTVYIDVNLADLAWNVQYRISEFLALVKRRLEAESATFLISERRLEER